MRHWEHLTDALQRASDWEHRRVQDEALRLAQAGKFLNVVGYSSALTFEDWKRTVLSGWVAASSVEMNVSRDAELSKRRLLAKDAKPKIPLQLSEQMALEWIKEHGLTLVNSMGITNRRAIKGVISEGIRDGKSIQAISQRLVDVVGLDARYAKAVQAKRSMMETQGKLSQDQINRAIESYRRRLIKLRSQTIARTEIVTAKNEGLLQAWRTMQAEDELPSTAKKGWSVAEDERLCEICSSLGAAAPVPLRKPFLTDKAGSVMRPAAHPRCRCSLVLVD